MRWFLRFTRQARQRIVRQTEADQKRRRRRLFLEQLEIRAMRAGVVGDVSQYSSTIDTHALDHDPAAETSSTSNKTSDKQKATAQQDPLGWSPYGYIPLSMYGDEQGE